MDKYDIIDLVRAYIGVLLISIDAINGWKVCNWIIERFI